MNLDLDAEALAFRDEVREWLRANVPAERLPSVDTPEGDAAHRAWERSLSEAGLAVVSWPERYGGRAVPPLHALLFEEEYQAAGGPARHSDTSCPASRICVPRWCRCKINSRSAVTSRSHRYAGMSGLAAKSAAFFWMSR